MAVNVMSRHTIGGDTIVGQAVMQLDKHKELYAGEKRTFKLPIRGFSSTSSPHVFDTTGTELSLSNSPQIDLPTVVSISVHIPSIYENMCGWFYKIHEVGFFDTGGTKMWVVLNDKKLYIYDNPFDSICRSTLDTHDITDIEETEIDKLEIKMPGIIIKMNTKGVTSELVWAYGDDAAKTKGFWRRALVRHHHAPANSSTEKAAGISKVVTDGF
jgi:hypothetical protein